MPNAKFVPLQIVQLVLRQLVIDVKVELIFIMEIVLVIVQMELSRLIITMVLIAEIVQHNAKLALIIILAKLVKVDIR